MQIDKGTKLINDDLNIRMMVKYMKKSRNLIQKNQSVIQKNTEKIHDSMNEIEANLHEKM